MIKNKYEDIINLKKPISKIHKQMSVENRAMQFMPFSALTGYEEQIKEKERITEEKVDVNEEKKLEINQKLNYIKKENNKNVSIRFFKKDLKKSGGEYITVIEKISKIDEINMTITTQSNIIIRICDVVELEIL